MSRITLFEVIRAPPSRQIRAATDSTAKTHLPKTQTARMLPDGGYKDQVDGHIGRGAEQERGEAGVDGATKHGRGESQCTSRSTKGTLRKLSQHLARFGPESKLVRRLSPRKISLASCASVQRAKRPRAAILGHFPVHVRPTREAVVGGHQVPTRPKMVVRSLPLLSDCWLLHA